jgi:DNA-binding protein H-NS
MKHNTSDAGEQYQVRYTPPARYEATWTGPWDGRGRRPTAIGRTYREAVHKLLSALRSPS